MPISRLSISCIRLSLRVSRNIRLAYEASNLTMLNSVLIRHCERLRPARLRRVAAGKACEAVSGVVERGLLRHKLRSSQHVHRTRLARPRRVAADRAQPPAVHEVPVFWVSAGVTP